MTQTRLDRLSDKLPAVAAGLGLGAVILTFGFGTLAIGAVLTEYGSPLLAIGIGAVVAPLAHAHVRTRRAVGSFHPHAMLFGYGSAYLLAVAITAGLRPPDGTGWVVFVAITAGAIGLDYLLPDPDESQEVSHAAGGT